MSLGPVGTPRQNFERRCIKFQTLQDGDGVLHRCTVAPNIFDSWDLRPLDGERIASVHWSRMGTAGHKYRELEALATCIQADLVLLC